MFLQPGHPRVKELPGPLNVRFSECTALAIRQSNMISTDSAHGKYTSEEISAGGPHLIGRYQFGLFRRPFKVSKLKSRQHRSKSLATVAFIWRSETFREAIK